MDKNHHTHGWSQQMSEVPYFLRVRLPAGIYTNLIQPIRKPALHLITLSQAAKIPPSLETISAEHLCCASYIHISSLEVRRDK